MTCSFGYSFAETGLYQRSLRANCTWREVVEVLVMAPAVPETPVGVKTMRLGVLKLARLRRLKSSARNSAVMCSWIFVSLKVEKSQVARPGPVSVSRPRLPKNPLPAGGARNAAGLNHCAGLPRMIFPWKSGLINGRTGLRVSPSLEGL